MAAGKLSQTELIGSLYSEHHGWLINWLRGKLGCGFSAADLAQDTFVRLMVSGNTQVLREPRAYLTTVAKGLVIDHWRRRRLEEAYCEAVARLPEASVPSPEARLLLLEALARIDALLDGLNPRARTAFLMSRLEGLGHLEIARRLGISVSSVEKYMANAFRHCIAAELAE
jgi:RNA polymerase sigma-70 factor (ECF subfamily)